MAMQRVWLLNFDADDELAGPVGYTPSPAVVARFASLRARIGNLVPPGDAILEETPDAKEARLADGTTIGRAFCPTPRALRVLASRGATVVDVPSLDVLRRVNHRAFCAELGQSLPYGRYVRDRGELVATLASLRGPWVVKRAFGFAGRGRQRLRSNALDPSVEPFVRASLESGEGLQVEPWVERVADVGLHGFVSRTGTVTLGSPTCQITDGSGAWVESSLLAPGTLSRSDEDALTREAARTAGALVQAGYFGPFGIDAFQWKDADGNLRFNPRSEINARYSMGWAIGMGHRRPDLASELP